MRPFVQYYDAIYSDKNYQADTDILRGLVRRSARPNILEIGSGTGNQSALMCQWAKVTAVETDGDFLEVMRSKKLSSDITLFSGDIGALSAEYFDGAAAYFHVVNYIHQPNALTHLLSEIFKRLKPGAPILFDMWHAECVLHDPPRETTRTKPFDNYLGIGQVTQCITPQLDTINRNVTLNYTITIAGSITPEPFTETIALHLWTQDEIVGALRGCGFTDIRFYDGRSYPAPATAQSWALWVVAKKETL
jgi:SAM-dependent methyltransferase